MKKLIVYSIVFLWTVQGYSQVNFHELNQKKIYFGIAMGANMSKFNIHRSVISTTSDSILGVRSTLGPGFNLGIIGNWQFHRYFDLRLIPGISFSEKNIVYDNKYTKDETRNVQSIAIHVPLMVRYKSEPVKDFRIFVLGGIRYDYDMNAAKRIKIDNNTIKLNPHDVSAEYGVGFSYYFPYFIFSPEFKMTHGLLNLKAPGQTSPQGNVLQSIFNRVFTITVNFEG